MGTRVTRAAEHVPAEEIKQHMESEVSPRRKRNWHLIWLALTARQLRVVGKHIGTPQAENHTTELKEGHFRMIVAALPSQTLVKGFQGQLSTERIAQQHNDAHQWCRRFQSGHEQIARALAEQRESPTE